MSNRRLIRLKRFVLQIMGVSVKNGLHVTHSKDLRDRPEARVLDLLNLKTRAESGDLSLRRPSQFDL